jgi:tetratricopeptide (TPR) repeat protein
MVLTIVPSELKRKLSAVRGVGAVKLWKLAFEAELYAAARDEKRKRDSLEDQKWNTEMLFFLSLTPQLQGRQLYFRHQFDSDNDKPGAATQYLMGRTPEGRIQKMASDPDLQKQAGLDRAVGETEESWRLRMQYYQGAALFGNQLASYWLGLLHYENGDYESAINWFLNRNLNGASQTIFASGARYNLGRSYEALGKFEEARQEYLKDTSPQKHGNLVRARKLQKRLAAGL